MSIKYSKIHLKKDGGWDVVYGDVSNLKVDIVDGNFTITIKDFNNLDVILRKNGTIELKQDDFWLNTEFLDGGGWSATGFYYGKFEVSFKNGNWVVKVIDNGLIEAKYVDGDWDFFVRYADIFTLVVDEDGKWKLVRGDNVRLEEVFPMLSSCRIDGKYSVDGLYCCRETAVKASVISKNVYTKEPAVHYQGLSFFIDEDTLYGRRPSAHAHTGHYPTFEQIYDQACKDFSDITKIELDDIDKHIIGIFDKRDAFTAIESLSIYSVQNKDYLLDGKVASFLDGIESFYIFLHNWSITKKTGETKLIVTDVLRYEDLVFMRHITSKYHIDTLEIHSYYAVTILQQLATAFYGIFADSKILVSNGKDPSFEVKDNEMSFLVSHNGGDVVSLASCICNIGKLRGFNFVLNKVATESIVLDFARIVAYAYVMSSGNLRVDVDFGKYMPMLMAGYIKADKLRISSSYSDSFFLPPTIVIEYHDDNRDSYNFVEIKERDGSIAGYIRYDFPYVKDVDGLGAYADYLHMSKYADSLTIKTCSERIGTYIENQAILGKYPKANFKQLMVDASGEVSGISGYELKGDKLTVDTIWPDEYLRLDMLLPIVNEVDINGNIKYSAQSDTLEISMCTDFYDEEDTLKTIIAGKPFKKLIINTCGGIYTIFINYLDRVEELILLAAQLNPGIAIEYSGTIPKSMEFGIALSRKLTQYGVKVFLVNGFNLMNNDDLVKYLIEYYPKSGYFFNSIRNDTILELHEKDEGYTSIEPVQKMKENQRTIYRLFAEKKEYNVLSVKQQKVVQVLKLMEKRVTGSGLTYVLLKYIIEYGQVNPDKYEHWLAGTLTFDEALNLSIDLTLHAIGTIFDKDKKVIGLDDSVADKPPKDIKVEYDISKKDDGSYEVKYIAKDADGKDATDRFHTMTIGNTFLHKEL